MQLVMRGIMSARIGTRFCVWLPRSNTAGWRPRNAAQAWKLSAPEWAGCSTVRIGAHRADAVHSGLATKCGTAPPCSRWT